VCVLLVVMGVDGSCIAIHYTLEPVKAEQTVDIFQSIKSSCICQTSLISIVVSETVKLVSVPSHFLNSTSGLSSIITVKHYPFMLLLLQEQYQHCHQAVLEFLDEFLAYLNFMWNYYCIKMFFLQ